MISHTILFNHLQALDETILDAKRGMLDDAATCGPCHRCSEDMENSEVVVWQELADDLAGLPLIYIHCGDCFDAELDRRAQALCDQLNIGACKAERLVRLAIYSIDGRDLFFNEDESAKLDEPPTGTDTE